MKQYKAYWIGNLVIVSIFSFWFGKEFIFKSDLDKLLD